jgi:hypothetical protein
LRAVGAVAELRGMEEAKGSHDKVIEQERAEVLTSIRSLIQKLK